MRRLPQNLRLLLPLGAFAFNTFFQLFGAAKLNLLCLVLPFRGC